MDTGMESKAAEASSFIKAMSHEGRLAILCLLIQSEKSVQEIEKKLSIKQAAVSQHLGRLRLEGMVAARRDGKKIYYRIADRRVSAIASVLHELFCNDEGQK